MTITQPEDWDNPASRIFDNIVNQPRRVKHITVKDGSKETVFVSDPNGFIFEISEEKAQRAEMLGLSIRRVTNE